MLSFWPRANRYLILAGLMVACSASSFAGPFSDLESGLKEKSNGQVLADLRRIAPNDASAQHAVQSGAAAARAYIGLRATLEGGSKTPAIDIPVPKADDRMASSWLARAFERLRAPKIDFPEPKLGQAKGFGSWLTVLMWTILGLLAGLAIFLLARYARLPWVRGKAKPIAPDEPLRSADAWLEEANSLIAAGKYREAVRGLYVAGLMRMDEAGVARFDPNQTNWEHLRRIEASPKRPAGSDIRGATGRFDRCWYGHLPSTAEDATIMRSWYDGLVFWMAEANR